MNILFSTIPGLANVFCGGSLFRRFSLAISLYFFAVSRKLNLFVGEFELKVIFNDFESSLYLERVMDLAVLKEVYLNKEYEWFPIDNPKVIVDLGAHFGDTTLYYHAIYPNTKIISVEPSPHNYNRLQKHVKGIENISTVNAAVGETNGTINLNITPSSLGHSVMSRAESSESVEVQMVTLLDLLKKHNLSKIDILKFDIEGAEFKLLETIPKELIVSTFIGEVHFDLVEGYNIEWIKAFFKDYQLSIEPLSNKNRFIIKAKK